MDADKVAVSSKILGRIAVIYAAEGDPITKGKLLAELDSSDLVAQKQLALAAKSQAEASVSQTKAKYTFDQLSIRVQEVALHKAKEDLARATLQYEGKILTRQAFEHSLKTYESALAQPEASKIR